MYPSKQYDGVLFDVQVSAIGKEGIGFNSRSKKLLPTSDDEATPKTIMLMGVPGLTLYHLKSHIQKYRLSRNLQVQASQVLNKSGSIVFAERFPEISGALTNGTNPFHTNPGLQITEALEMQIEVQRRLHEQLEMIFGWFFQKIGTTTRSLLWRDAGKSLLEAQFCPLFTFWQRLSVCVLKVKGLSLLDLALGKVWTKGG